MSKIKIGIIGGTGMLKMNLFQLVEEVEIETPFGKPSSSLVCGKLDDVDCVILSRHGNNHTLNPSNVNYRANIFALKKVGCDVILATTACGSLVEEAKPGDFVIVDQFIDRTTKRACTFYDGTYEEMTGVCHIPCNKPFSEVLMNILHESCNSTNVVSHNGGTVITIEGPRFSSYAESLMFKSWGAKVINMTAVPEVVLANEVGIPYASIAMVTDYDCWRNDEEAVDVAKVMATMNANRENALKVILKAVSYIKEKPDKVLLAIENAKQVAQTSIF